MTTHEGKVVIVTGGRRGIGRGVADLLAKRGAKVVIINRADAADAAEAIGHGAIAADVTSEAEWAEVAGTVEGAFGRADILVQDGVVGLVRALASELAADNIIVNAVHPGITDTKGASGMPNKQKAQVYMQQAIKRLGTPADIAVPAAFLTSDAARFLTGQTLVVDGGWLRL